MAPRPPPPPPRKKMCLSGTDVALGPLKHWTHDAPAPVTVQFRSADYKLMCCASV